MPPLWGNLMKKHLSSRQGTQQPWQFLKPDPATAAPDCCKDLRDGLREPCRDELLVASEQRPESARMPTTKCSPLWNWRLDLISLSRVVYYGLLGLVWYSIDCISLLIDIDCILVWLARLAKYIYIDCIVYLWLVVFKDLLEVGKCSVLSRSNVECENCGWQSNASACTDHGQSYHSSHRSTSHNSAQGTVITPSSVTCVRRDGVRDELRETYARFLALRQLTPQFKQKENVHIKLIKAGFNVTSRHHNTLKSHVFRAWRWLLWHLCSQEVFNLRCLSVLCHLQILHQNSPKPSQETNFSKNPCNNHHQTSSKNLLKLDAVMLAGQDTTPFSIAGFIQDGLPAWSLRFRDGLRGASIKPMKPTLVQYPSTDRRYIRCMIYDI